MEIFEWGVQGHENLDSEIKQVTNQEQLYYILSVTFISTEKAKEEEKKGTVSIVRKTPKNASERKSDSCSKNRKNDSFETAKQGDMEINIDLDDDLSDDSDNPDLWSLQVSWFDLVRRGMKRSKLGENNSIETVRSDEKMNNELNEDSL